MQIPGKFLSGHETVLPGHILGEPAEAIQTHKDFITGPSLRNPVPIVSAMTRGCATANHGDAKPHLRDCIEGLHSTFQVSCSANVSQICVGGLRSDRCLPVCLYTKSSSVFGLELTSVHYWTRVRFRRRSHRKQNDRETNKCHHGNNNCHECQGWT